MADGVPTCSAQVVPPALLTCKTNSGAHSDQGTHQGADLPDSDPQRVLLSLEPDLPTLRQQTEPWPYPLWRVSSGP